MSDKPDCEKQPAEMQSAAYDREQRRIELETLNRLGEILAAMPDGAKGRALRYFISFYSTQVEWCGRKGEP
jgi:hypothetical protein